jgi:glutaredoxin
MISVNSIVDSATVAVFAISRDMYSTKARELLQSITQDVTIYEIDTMPDGVRIQQELMDLHGLHTLPVVFIKGTLVGGFYEVDALHRTGNLEKKFS